jgi:hypothetical protein
MWDILREMLERKEEFLPAMNWVALSVDSMRINKIGEYFRTHKDQSL